MLLCAIGSPLEKLYLDSNIFYNFIISKQLSLFVIIVYILKIAYSVMLKLDAELMKSTTFGDDLDLKAIKA